MEVSRSIAVVDFFFNSIRRERWSATGGIHAAQVLQNHNNWG